MKRQAAFAGLRLCVCGGQAGGWELWKHRCHGGILALLAVADGLSPLMCWDRLLCVSPAQKSGECGPWSIRGRGRKQLGPGGSPHLDPWTPTPCHNPGRLMDILRCRGKRGYEAFLEALEFYYPEHFTLLTGQEPAQRCSMILGE